VQHEQDEQILSRRGEGELMLDMPYLIANHTQSNNKAAIKPIMSKCDSLKPLHERASPFAINLDPSPDQILAITEDARVLVVGAGGLGCEILKVRCSRVKRTPFICTHFVPETKA
jgi:hypothetical protein